MSEDAGEDGHPLRPLPGRGRRCHSLPHLSGHAPDQGRFFTRGTSRDEYALYTEEGDAYVRNMDRLLRKWETAKSLVPEPVKIPRTPPQSSIGMVFFGSSVHACDEALDILREQHGVQSTPAHSRLPVQSPGPAVPQRSRAGVRGGNESRRPDAHPADERMRA
jgi:pyruvate/2-oxoacid:ferredoxin oxidoreductase alpha subunit